MQDPEIYMGKRYAALNGYWSVIGYINKPAIVLRNPVTGEKETVVIGSPNHNDLTEISDGEALNMLENHVVFSE